jgi:hypothetical protein
MNRGDVVGWIVIDPETGEPVLWCKSRSEARRIAAESGARYARVVVA